MDTRILYRHGVSKHKTLATKKLVEKETNLASDCLIKANIYLCVSLYNDKHGVLVLRYNSRLLFSFGMWVAFSDKIK